MLGIGEKILDVLLTAKLVSQHCFPLHLDWGCYPRIHLASQKSSIERPAKLEPCGARVALGDLSSLSIGRPQGFSWRLFDMGEWASRQVSHLFQ